MFGACVVAHLIALTWFASPILLSLRLRSAMPSRVLVSRSMFWVALTVVSLVPYRSICSIFAIASPLWPLRTRLSPFVRLVTYSLFPRRRPRK